MVQRGLVVVEITKNVAGLACWKDAFSGIHIGEVDADAHGRPGEDTVVNFLLQLELVFAQGVFCGAQFKGPFPEGIDDMVS